jgi:hypothetical protein
VQVVARLSELARRTLAGSPHCESWEVTQLGRGLDDPQRALNGDGLAVSGDVTTMRGDDDDDDEEEEEEEEDVGSEGE